MSSHHHQHPQIPNITNTLHSLKLSSTTTTYKFPKMKFTAAASALFAGLAAAAPQDNQARNGQSVTLTFWAAAENTFTVNVPLDGTTVSIASDLSFSKIQSSTTSKRVTVCHAYGVDGSDTILYGSSSADIGPPQEQTYAVCFFA